MDAKENLQKLADFSFEIRKTTLKRLQEVPLGFMNWRLNTTALSFAHIVQHLINVDDLFFSLTTSKEKQFQWKLGSAEPHQIVENLTYEVMIEKLKEYGQKRHTFISAFDAQRIDDKVVDENGNEITFWWFIMRNVLEHEIYHIGQLAAYLKVIKGETSN